MRSRVERGARRRVVALLIEVGQFPDAWADACRVLDENGLHYSATYLREQAQLLGLRGESPERKRKRGGK